MFTTSVITFEILYLSLEIFKLPSKFLTGFWLSAVSMIVAHEKHRQMDCVQLRKLEKH